MHIHAARRYSDYVRTPSGLQYQDLRPGDGPAPKPGSSVTVDWDGYTIGRGPLPGRAHDPWVAKQLGVKRSWAYFEAYFDCLAQHESARQDLLG